jgi:hypothetical protein
VVGEVQEELDIPNSTLSHHPDKLRNEDLVHVRRESIFLRYTANTEALQETGYREKLAAAGFEQIEVEPIRIYRMEDARGFLSAEAIDVDAIAPGVDEKFMSAFVRATKPMAPFGPGSSRGPAADRERPFAGRRSPE